MLLSVLAIASSITSAGTVVKDFRSTGGYVYDQYNDVIPFTPGEDVIEIAFPPNYNYPGLVFESGYYIVDFEETDDRTGSFTVVVNGMAFPADETITTQKGVIEYKIDLHIDTSTGGIDIQSPSKVTGLIVTDAKDGKLDLSWNSASDNVGVDHYNIYRTGVLLTTTSSTSYQDTGLTDGQVYTYEVSAVDAETNEGEKSDPMSGISSSSSSGNNGGGGSTGGGDNSGSSGDGDGDDGYYGGSTFVPVVVADASDSETVGSIGIPVNFDGSKSTGNITTYTWNFGDGTAGIGITTTHTYDAEGKYTTILTVSDGTNFNADTFELTITDKPNIPPSQPEVSGEQHGTKNVEYSYNALSTDEDGDNIQYTFNWGDDSDPETSNFLASGTVASMMHSWSASGKYTVTVTADDGLMKSADTYIVYIDAVDVGSIGYLTDDDSDKTYDTFYGDNGVTTDVEKQKDGTYYIDEDSDGEWDWVYDPDTKELDEYVLASKNYAVLYAGALGTSLIIVLAVALALMSNKEKSTKDSNKKKSKKTNKSAKSSKAKKSNKPKKSKK